MRQNLVFFLIGCQYACMCVQQGKDIIERFIPVSQLCTSDDQNTGASTQTTILSMSIQGWFLLRLTGLISQLSKGL